MYLDLVEIALIIAVGALVYTRTGRRGWRKPEASNGPSAAATCHIVDKDGHVMFERPTGHKDLAEALSTPGMAVLYPDGSIDYGKQ